MIISMIIAVLFAFQNDNPAEFLVKNLKPERTREKDNGFYLYGLLF